MNIINRLTSIYPYESEKTDFSNRAPRNCNIMSYQLSGRYDHTFDFGVLEVKKDHVFNIGFNDSYSVHRVEKGTSICFVFTSDSPIQTELIDCSDDPRLSVLFRKLLHRRNLDDEVNYCMALSIAYEIIGLLGEKKKKEYFPQKSCRMFSDFREYLMNNFYDNGINLSEAPKKYGVSDKYFREKFSSLYGSTPTQYLISLRLNEAAKLLREGTLSIGEIAETVGFSDVYYFSRLFKKRFLCSPSNFSKTDPKL